MDESIQSVPIGRRAQQARETRDLIIKLARALFAKRGFTDTTIEDILRRTRVARGALYHHFRDKEDLFRAVYEQTLREAHTEIVEAASQATEIWERLRLGREAFLDSCTEPAVYRILLMDGPSVLSPDVRRQIRNSMGPDFEEGALLRASLDALVASGQAKLESFEPLVTILAGAFDAAALAIATAEDRKQMRRDAGAALNLLIDGLRALASGTGQRDTDEQPALQTRRPKESDARRRQTRVPPRRRG